MQLLEDILGGIQKMNNTIYDTKEVIIPSIIAGFPSLEAMGSQIDVILHSGLSVIEVVIPFSDPVAETEESTCAQEYALKHGTSLVDFFDVLSMIHAENPQTKFLLKTYLNQAFRYGYDLFFSSAKKAGVIAINVIDLPSEEMMEVKETASKYHIQVVSSIAPTSKHRIKMICENAEGYLNVMLPPLSQNSSKETLIFVHKLLEEIRESTSLPLVARCNLIGNEGLVKEFREIDAFILDTDILKMIENNGIQDVTIIEKALKRIQDKIE